MWVIIAKFGSHEFLEVEYPTIYNHLLQYKDQLEKRGQCRYSRGSQNSNKPYPGQHHWLELDNNPRDSYLQEFEKEKIVYPCIMAKEPCFVYEEKGFYAPAPANIITGDKIEIKYITALLNSKCIYFTMCKFYMGGGIEGELKTNNLEKIPIPKITPQNQKLAHKITDGAKAILEAKEKDPKANTQQLEKEIDTLVYQLYNLTDEEIKIIEEEQ
ncbi:hypothetical protein JP0110_00830 [Helicobacter pylori]|uniref:TaqI-like C-terminal specificity domain-containing protein n=1 Tax=Helicobacter pylori TaxID=210 RepID=UPI001AAAE6EB|nr:hypothetical protein JP0110_00830 [Helicobacter pylori]